jgi:hypothetical protein
MGAPLTALPKLESGESDASAIVRFDTRARFLLGVLVIAQFVVLVGYVIYSGRELPDSQLILGAEIGFVVTVLNYFFGSSSGSVTKSASVAKKGASTEPTSTPSSP